MTGRYYKKMTKFIRVFWEVSMLNAKHKELCFLVKKKTGSLKRTCFKPKPVHDCWSTLLSLSKQMQLLLLLHHLHGSFMETFLSLMNEVTWTSKCTTLSRNFLLWICQKLNFFFHCFITVLAPALNWEICSITMSSLASCIMILL